MSVPRSECGEPLRETGVGVAGATRGCGGEWETRTNCERHAYVGMGLPGWLVLAADTAHRQCGR